jgi:hypothetical protein
LSDLAIILLNDCQHSFFFVLSKVLLHTWLNNNLILLYIGYQ